MRQARNRERGDTPKTKAIQSVKVSLKNQFMLTHEFLSCVLERPACWSVRTPYNLN